MKAKFFLPLVLALSVLLLTACAVPTASASGPVPQLTATGTGEVFLTPDLAYVYIGVQSQSGNVGDALSENNQQAQAIVDALVGLGVERNDIQTSAFNVYPQPQYDPNGQIVETRYVVDNTVYITVRELGKLGQLLDTVVGAGANSINGIQFDVKDKTGALTEARKQAIEKAKANAQELAGAADVSLGRLININVYSGSGPIFEGKGGMGSVAVDVPISSGQLKLTVNADLTYEIK